MISEKVLPEKLTGRSGVGLFFIAIVAAFVAAALSGVGMAWDGSYNLFRLEDTRFFYVDNNRWSPGILQLPVLLAINFTRNFGFLQTLFGMTYSLVPIGALALSWWCVRERAPQLFIWAVLGIGMGTLPTQTCSICDSVMALQLSWVVFLSILVGLPKNQLPVISLLCLWILFFHPVSIILFGMAAGLCLFKWLWLKEEPRAMLYGFGAFLLLILAAVIKLEVFLNPYDAGQLSPDVLIGQYSGGVRGLPQVFVALAWVLGLMVVLVGLAVRRGRSGQLKGLRLAEFGLLGAAGIVLIVRSIDIHLWASAFDYRTWAIFFAIPFVGMAALDYWLNHPQKGENQPYPALWKERLPVTWLIGGIFFVVLAIQSVVWSNMAGEFKTAIAQRPESCISLESLSVIKDTPINNWSVTAYSLLTGGETPSKVVLLYNDCSRANLAAGLPLSGFDWRPWGRGHVNLEALRQKIVTGQARPYNS